MSNAGLMTKSGGAIPLRGVEVTGEVVGGWARVVVRQRYQNAEAKPVEAVYTFPLPADATLAGFAMSCNGRRIEGEVREREEAFRAYDDAIVAGHGAALVEQERPNVFTASVGNLLPGEETLVELEYLQRVQADEGALRWMIPTLVAPRYIPGAPAGDRTGHGRADPTDRVPDADRITPPHARQVGYGLALDLTFDLGRDVVVESPSHAVKTEKGEGHRVRVTLAQREVALDRDVVLTARGANESQQLVTVAAHRQGDEDGFFALTVVPDLLPITRTPPRQDVVFVIDTSGSMVGASLPQAQAALRLCMRHLREGDRFNVIEFNSTHRAFAPEPVLFTQRTLEQADAWVAALYATGGTEILGPMVEAVRSAKDGVVVLLTDGQVGNEDEILREVMAARGRARVYSFGIGTNVSDALLRGLARQTGGAVEFIHPGERIDEKVVAQFARAVAARVTDVSVKFVGVEAGELAPGELPALVDGDPWVLFGRYEKGGLGRAEIRGKLGGETFALEVPFELPSDSSRPAIPKLWAAERIRDFEAMALTGRRADAMKDRIVKLAVEFGVASRYTSFVVVEKRTGDRRASGQPETRVVPVNLPAGWAMFQQHADLMEALAQPAKMTMTCAGLPRAIPMAPPPPPMVAPPPAPGAAYSPPTGAPPPMPPSAPARGPSMLDRATAFFTGAVKKAVPPPARSSPMPAPGTVAQAPSSGDPVVDLLGRQLASGLWDEPGLTGDEEVRTVRATARALLELLRVGVTTAHPLHGAQVRKAVQALAERAARIAGRAPQLAEFALGVAWLIASGRRTRGEVEAAVAREAALAALRARFADEQALRAHVDQAAATV